MDMEQKDYDFATLSDEQLKQLSLLENDFSRDKNEDIILVAYQDRKCDP